MNQLLFKQVQPPTGVTHSAFACFSGYDDVNLCVVKNSSLDVYFLVPATSEGFGNSSSSDNLEKMYLWKSFSLYGDVETMEVIRFSNTDAQIIGEPYGFDALLLSFPGSKCSIVAYDPLLDCLRTISMHNFSEVGEGYGTDVRYQRTERGDRADRGGLSLSCVDPQFRCAVVMGHDDQLLVLPFRHHDSEVDPSASSNSGGMNSGDPGQEMDIDDGGVKPSVSSLVLQPYVIALDSKEMQGSVIDMTFLHGNYEPTLLFLIEEPIKTWAGGFSSASHTSKLVAVSMNLLQKRNPIIWNIKGLPYDTLSVHGIPGPVGGAILLSSNAIFYFNQNHNCSVATNGYAAKTVDPKVSPIEPNEKRYNLVLSKQSKLCFLKNTRSAVLTAENGDIFRLRLVTASNIVTKLVVDHTGNRADVSSAVSTWDRNDSRWFTTSPKKGTGLVFLGSWLGDSLLLKYELKSAAGPQSGGAAGGARGNDVKSGKLDDSENSDEDDDDAAFLYGNGADTEALETETAKASVAEPDEFLQFSLSPCDKLINLGPVSSVFLDTENRISKHQGKLIASAGHGINGGVCVLHQGDVLYPQFDFTLKGGKPKGAWVLPAYRDGEVEYQCVMLTVGKKTKLISIDSESQIQPLQSGTNLVSDEATVAAGVLNTGVWVQVLRQSLNLYSPAMTESPSDKMPMETLDFSNGGTRSVTPCLASILGQYFAVGLDDGSVQVFEATSGASYKKVTDIPVAHGRVVSCLRLFSDDDHVSSAKNILVKDPVRRPDYPISTKKTNASQKNTKGNASDDEDAVEAALYGSTKKESMDVDEDEEDIYGGAKDTVAPPLINSPQNLNSNDPPRQYLALGFDDGTMSIVNLPRGDVVFETQNLASGAWLLLDQDQSLTPYAQSNLEKFDKGLQDTAFKSAIADVQISYLGSIVDEEEDEEEDLGEASAGLKQNASALVLTVVLDTGDLLIYKRHPQPNLLYAGKGATNRLPLAFIRVEHAVITRPPKLNSDDKHESKWKPKGNRLLTACSNIGGKSMVFCNTFVPVWVSCDAGFTQVRKSCISSSGDIEVEDHSNAVIAAVTPIDNGLCDNGLLLVSSKGRAYFVEAGVDSDAAGYQSEQISTGCQALLRGQKNVVDGTIYQLCKIPSEFCGQSNVFVALTSRETEEPASSNADDAPELSDLGVKPTPYLHQFSVQIVAVSSSNENEEDEDLDGGSVTAVETLFSYNLEKFERGISVGFEYIYDNEDKKLKPFLCVGTGFLTSDGNDTAGKGKIIAFSFPNSFVEFVKVSEERNAVIVGAENHSVEKGHTVCGSGVPRDTTVLDVSGNLIKLSNEISSAGNARLTFRKSGTAVHQFTLAHFIQFPAGVTTLGGVCTKEVPPEVSRGGGTLLATAGRQMSMMEIRGGRLMKIGFFDLKVTVSSMNIIKNFIACSDIYNSVQFFRWNVAASEVELLAYDPYPACVVASTFIVAKDSLQILIADANGSIFVLQYDPHSTSGTYRTLRSVAEFHSGSRITALTTYPVNQAPRLRHVESNVYGSIYGTCDGSFGVVVPVLDRKIFRRLIALQSFLNNALKQNAGLNPREYRSVHVNFTSNQVRPHSNTMLDMTLLLRYVSLDSVAQHNLARSVGTNPQTVMESLRSLEESIQF